MSLRTNKKGAWGRTSLWLDFVSEELAKQIFFKHATFYQPDNTLGGIQWTLQSQHWAIESEEQILASIRGLTLTDIEDRRKLQDDADADLPTYFCEVGRAMEKYHNEKVEAAKRAADIEETLSAPAASVA